MKKLIVFLVLVGAGFGFYKFASAKSEAYLAYEAFANAVLFLQYEKAHEYAENDEVDDYVKERRSPERFFGRLEWQNMNNVMLGPVRDIVEEEVLEEDQKVRLKVVQEVRKGPVNIGAFGPMNFRETHDVVMVNTDEGWMVASIEADIERLSDR